MPSATVASPTSSPDDGISSGRLSLHRIQLAKREWEEHRRRPRREIVPLVLWGDVDPTTGGARAAPSVAPGAGAEERANGGDATAAPTVARIVAAASGVASDPVGSFPRKVCGATMGAAEAEAEAKAAGTEKEALAPSTFSFPSAPGGLIDFRGASASENRGGGARGAFSLGFGTAAAPSAAGASSFGFGFETTPGTAEGTKFEALGRGGKRVPVFGGVGTGGGANPFSIGGGGLAPISSSASGAPPAPFGGFGGDGAFGVGGGTGAIKNFGGFGGGAKSAASPFAAPPPFSLTTGEAACGSSADAVTGLGSLEQKMPRKEEEKGDHRKKLANFYQKYNPSKLGDVDKTLANYHGREDELFRKLEQKYGVTKSPYPDPPSPGELAKGPVVYMDLSLGGVPAGRVSMRLFADLTPLAAENFRSLCAEEYNPGGRRRGYEGCAFHRIVENFVLQGGDFTKGDGTGGASIYSPNSEHGDAWGKFKDEKPFLKHSRKGLLSMANNGPDRNGSQFFVTLKALPFLDGKHVVFGEVVDGMDIFERIVKEVQVDPKNKRPKEGFRVVIERCGECTEK